MNKGSYGTKNFGYYIFDIFDEMDELSDESKQLIKVIYYKCWLENKVEWYEKENKTYMQRKLLFPGDEEVLAGKRFIDWYTNDWDYVMSSQVFCENQYDKGFLFQLYSILGDASHTRGVGRIPSLAYIFLYVAYILDKDDECSREMSKLLKNIPDFEQYEKNLEQWDIVLEYKRFYEIASKVHTLSQNPYGTNLEWLDVTVISFLNQKDDATRKEILKLLSMIDNPEIQKRIATLGNLRNEIDGLLAECIEQYRKLTLNRRKDRKTHKLLLLDFKKRFCGGTYSHAFLLLDEFKDVIYEKVNPKFSINMPYDVWKMTYEWCVMYDDEKCLNLREMLTNNSYCASFYKRYEMERLWEQENISRLHYEKILPQPPLNEGRIALLSKMEGAMPCAIGAVPELTYVLRQSWSSMVEEFLIRVTDAMVNFKFILMKPRYEVNPTGNDAYCFMENEVVLYCHKRHRVCRMSHKEFFEEMTYWIDNVASRNEYSQEFIEKVVKNLYIYGWYVNNVTMG